MKLRNALNRIRVIISDELYRYVNAAHKEKNKEKREEEKKFCTKFNEYIQLNCMHAGKQASKQAEKKSTTDCQF